MLMAVGSSARIQLLAGVLGIFFPYGKNRDIRYERTAVVVYFPFVYLHLIHLCSRSNPPRLLQCL